MNWPPASYEIKKENEMEVVKRIKVKARASVKRIVLPEGD